jgi:hypothetical protein
MPLHIPLVAQLVAVAQRHRPWRVFERPIFLIAAPRSGSTLLQDLLSAHPDVVSWPFEATQAYERARMPDHPLELGHRWPPDYADASLRRRLSRELYRGRLAARRRNGLPTGVMEPLALRKVRLLEKTPANVLRVEVLAELYPDARFVFLHRDAPASIGSLIEAWETPSAARGRLQAGGREVEWMMLAPPGWLDLLEAPYPERAAFQWRAAADYALAAFDRMDRSRWMRLGYEDLLADSEGQLRRILEFVELSAHPDVLASVTTVGNTGREAEILPLLPQLADVRRRLGYLPG